MQRESNPAKPRTLYIENADGIRGLACLIVLLIHAVAIYFPLIHPYLIGSAKYGVWLFFVLSAFLLTNHLMHGELTRAKLADYAVGRFLRIVPLYFIAILAYRIFGTAGISSTDRMVQALAMTKGFVHLWTIPVEMKFYVLLALLILPIAWLCKHLGNGASLVFVACAALAAVLLFPPSNGPENAVALGWYAPCFLMGVGAAVIYPSVPRINGWICGTISLGVMLALVMATNYFRPVYGGPVDPKWLMNKSGAIGLAWTVFLLVNVNRGGWWSSLWNNPILRLAGRWSYSIYLFHWLVFFKLIQVAHRSVATMSCALVLAVALGAAMHHLVERPLMNLRRALAVRRSEAPALGPAS